MNIEEESKDILVEDDQKSTIKDNDLIEYASVYYRHQYDRIAKLEEQRLIFTNIVIALTAISLTFGYSSTKKLTIISGIGIPFVLILLNIFAYRYIKITREYMKAHRARAKEVLKKFALEIYKIDKSISLPPLFLRFGLGKIQSLIHISLILLSLIPTLMYFKILS
jgi:uncharacterized membrane protein